MWPYLTTETHKPTGQRRDIHLMPSGRLVALNKPGQLPAVEPYNASVYQASATPTATRAYRSVPQAAPPGLFAPERLHEMLSNIASRLSKQAVAGLPFYQTYTHPLTSNIVLCMIAESPNFNDTIKRQLKRDYFADVVAQATTLARWDRFSEQRRAAFAAMKTTYDYMEQLIDTPDVSEAHPHRFVFAHDSEGLPAGVAAVRFMLATETDLSLVRSSRVALLDCIATRPASLGRLDPAPQDAGREVFAAVEYVTRRQGISTLYARIPIGALAAFRARGYSFAKKMGAGEFAVFKHI